MNETTEENTVTEVTTTAPPDLSETAFVILQTAVSQVRDLQIKSVQALRDRLNALYPGCQPHVEQAIVFWSAYVRSRGYPER